jgi:Glycosyl transferase family group 2
VGGRLVAALLAYGSILAPVIFIPACIALVDFVTPLRARFKRLPEARQAGTFTCTHDFTVLVPIFGDASYLRNTEYLSQYGDRVVLCTTTHESDQFNAELGAIATEHGFRIFRSQVSEASKHHPNPWRLFRRTLERRQETNLEVARDEIVRDSFAAVDSRYTIFLDGDTTSPFDFELLVRAMEAQELDVASVRVLPSQQTTIMERLQGLEYRMAMDARRVYPWLTSGACMAAKTYCLKRVMLNHSLFFSGGDIEVGKLARILRFKVGHIPFVLYTDVPSTFRGWFGQRTAWFSGGFRHAIVNALSYAWRHPIYFAYTTLIVYAFTPLRLFEMIKHPWMLPVVILIYWALLALLTGRRWQWVYLLFPLYAMCQVMVLVPLGAARYAYIAWRSRNPGVIKLRHSRGSGRRAWKPRRLARRPNMVSRAALMLARAGFGKI